MALDVVAGIDALRRRLADVRRAGLSIGLVPTMGALHAGHARLIERARGECGFVVVSIFVNPLQFDREEDLNRYPRDLDADVEMCRSLHVNAVFAPTASAMYPSPPVCSIDVGRLAEHLCGRFRPGHFSAVAAVVMKLFQIVQPDVAYFGQKDAQQLAVVRQLIRDFNVAVDVVGVPTVREPDGLALSSRNTRLNRDERAIAGSLYQALRRAEADIASGAVDASAIRQHAAAGVPHDPRLRLEYLEIVDEADFQPVDRVGGPVIVAGALWVGSTRLIDNLRCAPPGHS